MITTLTPDKQYRIRMLRDTMFHSSGIIHRGTYLVISSYTEHPHGICKWMAKYGKYNLLFNPEDINSMFTVTEEINAVNDFNKMIAEDRKDAESFLNDFSLKELRDTASGLLASAKSLRKLIKETDKFDLYSIANSLANSFRKEFGIYLPELAKFSDASPYETSRTRCISLSANLLAIFDISAQIIAKSPFDQHSMETISYILSLADADPSEDLIIKTDTDNILTFLSIHEKPIIAKDTDINVILGFSIKSPSGTLIASGNSISLANLDPVSAKIIKDTTVFKYSGSNISVLLKQSGDLAIIDMSAKKYLSKSTIPIALAKHIYEKYT